MKDKLYDSPWDVFWGTIKAAFQLAHGIRTINKMQQPIVTIFGGSKVKKDSFYAKKAFELAQLLAKDNVSILTGGGPGIMEAANCGAASVHKKDTQHIFSLGIGVKGIDEGFSVPCGTNIQVVAFGVRKLLLMRCSLGFVIFPGGIGTCDELFEVLNYMKHKKIPCFKILLFGKKYWQPIVDWYVNNGIGQGFIEKEFVDFLMVTDDVGFAHELLVKRLYDI